MSVGSLLLTLVLTTAGPPDPVDTAPLQLDPCHRGSEWNLWTRAALVFRGVATRAEPTRGYDSPFEAKVHFLVEEAYKGRRPKELDLYAPVCGKVRARHELDPGCLDVTVGDSYIVYAGRFGRPGGEGYVLLDAAIPQLAALDASSSSPVTRPPPPGPAVAPPEGPKAELERLRRDLAGEGDRHRRAVRRLVRLPGDELVALLWLVGPGERLATGQLETPSGDVHDARQTVGSVLDYELSRRSYRGQIFFGGSDPRDEAHALEAWRTLIAHCPSMVRGPERGLPRSITLPDEALPEPNVWR